MFRLETAIYTQYWYDLLEILVQRAILSNLINQEETHSSHMKLQEKNCQILKTMNVFGFDLEMCGKGPSIMEKHLLFNLHRMINFEPRLFFQ